MLDENFVWSDRVLRDQALEALRHVIDPDLHRDIVACGFVKQLRLEPLDGEAGMEVAFTLELTTPACPEKDFFRDECTRRLKALDWVQRVNLTFGARDVRRVDQAATALARVGDVLLVSSCKGGVGKSTTAVNLAFLLAQRGARVGLLDLDVYGASLPTLLPQVTEPVRMGDDGLLTPLTVPATVAGHRYGAAPPVKVLSPGWLRSEHISVRGALAAELTRQLILGSDWGELDYLLVDMPPGTSDVHLSVTELIPTAKFVLVTAPHELSLIDAERGYSFFTQSGLSCVGVVINGNVRSPDDGVARWDAAAATWLLNDAARAPPSSDWLRAVARQSATCTVPCAPELSVCRFELENGSTIGPLALAATRCAQLNTVLNKERSEALSVLTDFASELVRVLSAQRLGMDAPPEVNLRAGDLEILTRGAGGAANINIVRARSARLLCDCANCSRTLVGKRVPIDICAVDVVEVTLARVRVRFSDGHDASLAFRELLKPTDAATDSQQPTCVETLGLEW